MQRRAGLAGSPSWVLLCEACTRVLPCGVWACWHSCCVCFRQLALPLPGSRAGRRAWLRREICQPGCQTTPCRLQPDYSWEQDGEELHDFLEDGLAKHLKVQVRIKRGKLPAAGPVCAAFMPRLLCAGCATVSERLRERVGVATGR